MEEKNQDNKLVATPTFPIEKKHKHAQHIAIAKDVWHQREDRKRKHKIETHLHRWQKLWKYVERNTAENKRNTAALLGNSNCSTSNKFRQLSSHCSIRLHFPPLSDCTPFQPNLLQLRLKFPVICLKSNSWRLAWDLKHTTGHRQTHSHFICNLKLTRGRNVDYGNFNKFF